MGAIVLGLAGVLILSDMPGLEGRWWRRIANRAALLGLASGAFFAVSAVGYRGATLEVASADPLLRAGLTLAAVTLMQAVALTLWLVWREPGQVGRVIAARRTAVWMGLTGMAGSLCWFTAFTLQNAAMVFAVGQVEVIFSLLASVLVFGERITRREGWGIALVTASVLGVVALR
jgi:drug/metabolite transporter (DMT)-like permease